MTKRIDRTGQKFGRLTVLSYVETRKGKPWWLCECDCGTVREFRGEDLASGQQQSCGCLKREVTGKRNLSHGKCKTRIYKTWTSMIGRCHCPTAKGYDRYGGRGIKVCSRWRDSFEAFLEDMGEPPTPQHSIDRYPDNDGDYEPGNCRWATVAEQARNTRKTRLVTIDGRTMCLKDWCIELGKSRSSVQKNIYRRGMDEVSALMAASPGTYP